MKNNETKERPLECSSCKRPIAVKFSEVEENVKSCLYMCKECPRLDQYLCTENSLNYSESSGLVCGHCNTSLLNIQRGEDLGCSDCYQTFEIFINKELKEFSDPETSQVTHEGHKPGELKELSPSLKILALNEALAKTLNEENYEQAAWIRDQIMELKKKAKDQ